MQKALTKKSEARMDQAQLDLIKNTVARGATNDELKLFLYTANKTGLDPLAKQIHFIKRRVWDSKTRQYSEVGSIQTSIDGYRVIAERTKALAGIDDAIFDDESGDHPNKATVSVHKMVGGRIVDFTASARWSEYAQVYKKDGKEELGAMWKKMPYLMLGKCAESLALRKAFPNDLSGIYTQEEMQQSDNDNEESVKAPKADNEAKIKIASELRRLDIPITSAEKVKEEIKRLTGLTLEEKNYDQIIALLEMTGKEAIKAEESEEELEAMRAENIPEPVNTGKTKVLINPDAEPF